MSCTTAANTAFASTSAKGKKKKKSDAPRCSGMDNVLGPIKHAAHHQTPNVTGAGHDVASHRVLN